MTGDLDPRPFVLKPASGDGLRGTPAPLSIVTESGRDLLDEVSATYVSFRKSDGTPLTGKHVIITVTADGTDIQDITVEAL